MTRRASAASVSQPSCRNACRASDAWRRAPFASRRSMASSAELSRASPACILGSIAAPSSAPPTPWGRLPSREGRGEVGRPPGRGQSWP